MDNFCTTYAEFFRELQEFIELLCKRYKSDVPASLQNVASVCTVLQPGDPDLVPGREEQIAQKYCIVEHVMTELFNKAGRFVAEEHLGWFKERSEKLQWMMGTVITSFAILGLCACPVDITILSSGISGSNTGVRQGIDRETMMKLHEVMKELQ
ncbi:hypothetical protein BsWGS_01046 [Bradybaena similaris]